MGSNFDINDFSNDLGIEDTSELEAQLETEKPSNRNIQFNTDAQEVIEETEQAVEETEEDDTDLMDDVDMRLEVASYYRALLKNPLFGNNRNASSTIVEKEVRDFCRTRLRVLMGITTDKSPEKVIAPIQLPFTVEQIEALQQLSNTLIARSKNPVSPTVAPAKVAEPTVNPVNIPAPKARPTATKIVKTVERAKPGPKPKAKNEPPKPLFEEKVVGTDEKGEPVTIKKARIQRPAGRVPFPQNLSAVLLQQSAQQVAKSEAGGAGGVTGGSALFNKIMTHHSGGGNTGE